jgi:protein AroM
MIAQNPCFVQLGAGHQRPYVILALMARRRKVAFVTIGQSPRVDLVPEMLERIGPGIEPVEVGALDDLGPGAIAGLAPGAGDQALVSRLRDGREVTIGKAWTQRRLVEIMADLDRRDFDLIVLLCTGHFEGVGARTLLVEAQRVVDHTVDALAEDGRSVGVMVPLARQIDEFHLRAIEASARSSDDLTSCCRSHGETSVTMAHASPYSDGRFEDAARELAKTDLVVMHCMGYSEAMRRRVAAVTDKPVLLARRLVANTVAELIA